MQKRMPSRVSCHEYLFYLSNVLTVMKLILTGATGTIGGAVLAKAILEPAVAHIVVLSRRPVATITNSSKVTVLIVHDFMLYTEAELAQLDGADACIWWVHLDLIMRNTISR